MLMLGLVCFAAQSAMAAPAYLDGLWFKMKCKAKGYKVDTATGAYTKSSLNIPFYLGFAWNVVNTSYDYMIYTETAPGVWTQTYTARVNTTAYSQNFISDFGFDLYIGPVDHISIYHTPFIKYVMDGMGGVKKASLSGIGEVYGGDFGAGAFAFYGSCKISGKTVDPAQLPFTP
jgi:hypothetical protein